MYAKLLAASALTIGLATSAMAQSSEPTYTNHSWWLFGNHEETTVDPYTTGSIDAYGSGLSTQGNTGGIGPCAHNTPGPDANSGLNVNDKYCGK